MAWASRVVAETVLLCSYMHNCILNKRAVLVQLQWCNAPKQASSETAPGAEGAERSDRRLLGQLLPGAEGLVELSSFEGLGDGESRWARPGR